MDKKGKQQYQNSNQMEGADTANAYDEEFYEQVRQDQDKKSNSENMTNERDASWEAGYTGDQS